MLTLSEERDEWQKLISCEAWKWLEALAKEQASTRVNLIMLAPVENVYQQEFMKGEVAALQLCARMPELEIERLNGEIENLNKEQNDEQL